MGQSKHWVLVRGLMSEAFHWWDFLPRLQARFPSHHFHTADILGNGPTGHQATPLRVDRNIHALREQVRVPAKKIILGSSLGGMMALEWAYAHPDEVEAVVLINCSLASAPFYRRMRPGALAEIFKFSAFARGIERDILGLRLTTGLSRERCIELAEHWAARSKEYPVRPLNFFAQVGLATRVPMRTLPPPVPLLLMASRNDRVVHPECSERIAKAWKLPLILHPHAGHDVSLEDPDWLVTQLENWSYLTGTGI